MAGGTLLLIWQVDHLAGGPLRTALEAVNASAAAEFNACLQRHKRQSACFQTSLKPYPTPLVRMDPIPSKPNLSTLAPYPQPISYPAPTPACPSHAILLT